MRAWVIVAVALTAGVSSAAEVPGTAVRDSLAAARDRIEKLYYRFDVAQMQRGIEFVESLGGRAGWYGDYYRAVLCSHLSGRFLRDDEDRADQLLECAQDRLESALESRSHADLHALLGSVLGRRIAVSPLRAMWLGPKSLRHQEQALAADSTNPRAVLEMGRSLIYRPSAFGGDKREGRRLLLRSIELHASYTPEDSLMIDWGGPAEAYAFLAMLERDEGNFDQARSYAERALALEPDYALVLEEILPSLQRED